MDSAEVGDMTQDIVTMTQAAQMDAELEPLQPLKPTESRSGSGELGEQRFGATSPTNQFTTAFEDSKHSSQQSLVDPNTIPQLEPKHEPSIHDEAPPTQEDVKFHDIPSKETGAEQFTTKFPDNKTSSHIMSHQSLLAEQQKAAGEIGTVSPKKAIDEDEISLSHEPDTEDRLSQMGSKMNIGSDGNIFIKLIDTSGEKGVLEIDDLAEHPEQEEISEHGIVMEQGRRVSITGRVPAVHMGEKLEHEIEEQEKAAERRRQTLEALIDETDALQQNINTLMKKVKTSGKPASGAGAGAKAGAKPARRANAAATAAEKSKLKAEKEAEQAEAAAVAAKEAAGPDADELKEFDGPMKKFMYGWAQSNSGHVAQESVKKSVVGSKPGGYNVRMQALLDCRKVKTFIPPSVGRGRGGAKSAGASPGAKRSPGSGPIKPRTTSKPRRPQPSSSAPPSDEHLDGESEEKGCKQNAVHPNIYGWAVRGGSADKTVPVKPHRGKVNRPGDLIDDEDETARKERCRVKVDRNVVKVRIPKEPGCIFKSCAPIKPYPNFRDKPDSCLPVRK